ncbi:hypothetical protein FACS1894178_8820 [Bacteroidia bacterium]|nr:hypothetical protein FACS1894178_8820 [Bacteroidia bacterium]
MRDKLIHPYTKFENTDLWISIESSINDLIDNQDIKLTTRKEYVVGYICKQLSLKKKNMDIEKKTRTKNE